MNDLWVALGLVMVLEGAMYALFPSQMIEMIKKMPEMSPTSIRLAGLTALAIGWMLVKFIRG